MKERPILFSGPMVRAIEEGRKIKTRRVIKPQPAPSYPQDDFLNRLCPYGQTGDQLWVRETWRQGAHGIEYRADTQGDGPVDGSADSESNHWRPSIFMPRASSRITLEVVDIGVERVRQITQEDAKAEGVAPKCLSDGGFVPLSGSNYVDGFHELWDAINAKRGYGWANNPFVWVIEFKRLV